MNTNRIKKIWIVLLLSGTLGCSPSPKRQEGEATEHKVVTITVNNGPLEEDKEQHAENAAKLEVFYRLHPDIRVQESTWQYSPDSFLTKMAGGTCTDIIGVPMATELKGIVRKGLALDLTPMLEQWEGWQYLNPLVMRNYTTSDGRVWALPGAPGYAMGLGYNKRLFEEEGLVDAEGNCRYPKTWEELVEVAKKLTHRDRGQVGYMLLAGDSAASWHFLNWAYQAGGQFERESEQGKWIAVFNEPPVVRALQFIKDLRWKHQCVQEDIFIDNDALLQKLASGRAAMATITPEFLMILERRFGMNIDDAGLAPLPAGPAGYACVMGGPLGIINPTIPKERQEAAFKNLCFGLTPAAHEASYKVRRKQGRVVGYPGVPHLVGKWQKEWEEMEAKYRTLPYFGEYREVVAQSARFEPPHYCQQLYNQILLPILQEVLTNPNSDPQALLDDGVEKFQEQFLDELNL